MQKKVKKKIKAKSKQDLIKGKEIRNEISKDRKEEGKRGLGKARWQSARK